jgi:hypothetical protein
MNPGIILYAEHLQGLAEASQVDRDAVVIALLRWRLGRDFARPTGAAGFMFDVIKTANERFAEKRNGGCAKTERKAVTAAENGRKGGRPRSSTDTQKPNENPTKTQQETQQNPTDTTRHDTILNDTNQTNNNTPLHPPQGESEKGVDIEELFNKFYGAYPRKVGKPAALKAFKAKAKKSKDPKALLADILKGIEAHGAEWAGKDQQYIPHPSTFLNQERWKDEVPQQGTGTPTAPATTGAAPKSLKERCAEAIWDRLTENAPGLNRAEWQVYVEDQADRFVNRIGVAINSYDHIANREAFIASYITKEAKYHADKAGEDKASDALNRQSIWFGDYD